MNKALLNINELCNYLGIGKTKAREILKDIDCEFSLKIGNRWYADRKLLDDWLSHKITDKKGGF